MPSGSYTFGNPTGSNDEKMIENNYYAVIAPAHIRDAWPVPAWWFWTGPEPTGNTFGGKGNPATNDHTGNTDGAVLVVNAGTTLQPFYKRTATNLTPGNFYTLSFWAYLVNASSTIRLDIEDLGTATSLGNFNTGFMGTEGAWVQYSFNFQAPTGCAVSSLDINLKLSNALANNNGNDYYIDDIVLTDNGVAGSGTTFTCPISVALPVSLLDFAADVIDNRKVALSWKVAQETNMEQYIVERSGDAIHFQPVQAIKAGGNNRYSCTDDIARVQDRTIYYRLKMLETGGNYQYSNTQKIVRGAVSPGQISVSPNPVRNTLTVRFTADENTDAVLQIVDLFGRVVYRQAIKAAQGENMVSIDRNFQANGFCVVRISSAAAVLSAKVVMTE